MSAVPTAPATDAVNIEINGVAMTAPNEMMPAPMFKPRSENAVASGSAVPRRSHGSMPVSTAVTAM